MNTFWEIDKFYNLDILIVGNQISKVTLELWDDDWCGTNYGPTFEIRTQDNKRGRVTRSFNPAYKGDTLQWDNRNGKLGYVTNLKVSGASLRFKLEGQSGDDFCPKRFSVYTYGGAVYRSLEMNDWVDSSKGNQERLAFKDVNLLEY